MVGIAKAKSSGKYKGENLYPKQLGSKSKFLRKRIGATEIQKILGLVLVSTGIKRLEINEEKLSKEEIEFLGIRKQKASVILKSKSTCPTEQ